MSWSDTLTALNYVMAELYPFKEESIRLVESVGIPRGQVAYQAKALDNWYQILKEASLRHRIDELVRVALNEHPSDSVLIAASKGYSQTGRAPKIGEEIPWTPNLASTDLEKIMGRANTLLPIHFLELGLQRSRSVVCIRTPTGSGSGVLLEKNWILTNHHVIASEKECQDARFLFNYQKSINGKDEEPEEFQAVSGDGFFFTDKEDDWTVLKLKGDANSSYGFVLLDPGDSAVGERALIIQHPCGGPKQIGLYHNVIAYSDDNRIQYLTDTLPGSSGSPVFDDLWRLIGLHHSGGWIAEPTTGKHVFRNEGISVNAILKNLPTSDQFRK